MSTAAANVDLTESLLDSWLKNNHITVDKIYCPHSLYFLRILVFIFISQPQKTGTKTESCQLAKIRLEWISRSPLGLVIDRLNTTTSLYRIAPCLCTYQRPSRGVDPRDIRGKGAGFADFCRQFLALDGGIGPLLHFRGEVHGERPAEFVTSPPSWKWKIRIAGTGYNMCSPVW